jgi:hypothetical protein
MKKSQEIQRWFRVYKQETGIEAVDMRKFAEWMSAKGWKLPKPPDAIDMAAKQFADAIREEKRRDPITKLPYKANLAYSTEVGGQGVLWVDVDEAPRKVVHKCLVQRREQMVGDAYQFTLIQDHWNNMHPDEEPIQLPLDLQFDVELKKSAVAAEAEQEDMENEDGETGMHRDFEVEGTLVMP